MFDRLFFIASCSVLAATTTLVAGGVVVDAEPNDTTSTATPTELTGVGETIVLEAEIGNGAAGAADRDLFSFEASPVYQPYLLTVTMVAADPGFDGYLRLFDADGQELVNQDDDGYPNLNPLLQTYIVESGTYYIGVSHAMNPGYDATDGATGRSAGVGGYGLSIALAQASVPATSLESEGDPPIFVATLPVILMDQFIGDGDNKRLDVDRYRFVVSAPAIVTAVVRPARLRLLDPIVDRAYGETRPDLRVRRIEFAVYDSGPVEISVMGTRSAPTALAGRSVGFYDISIDARSVVSGPLHGPMEPNDSLIQARDVGLSGPGSATFFASIGDGEFGGTRGDIDCYRIEMSGLFSLQVDVVPAEGEPALEATVQLYDESGGRVGSWLPDDTGAVHLNHQPPLSADILTFTVVVMGVRDRITMDPFFPNGNYNTGPDDFRVALEDLDGGAGSTGAYGVTFNIGSTPAEAEQPIGWQPIAPRGAAEAAGVGPQLPAPVFASRLGFSPDAIIAMDSATGAAVAELTPPEVPFGGGEGLAYDGTDLFVLGNTGRYPYLYRLDAETGAVLDRMLTWFGSGVYGDITVLNDSLFVVDVLDDTLFSLPTSFGGTVSALDMGGLDGFSMYGPIAAARSPDRLLVTDADNPTVVLELNANDGMPVSFIQLGTNCGCNADFDGDGDVDDDDGAFLSHCDAGYEYAVVLECVVADLDCDGFVRDEDIAIFDCQWNGADVSPNPGCCPDGLPSQTVRATSLAAAYPHVLLAGEWNRPTLERFDLNGNTLGALVLADPVGTMASGPLGLFADVDGDGDVDLRDWRWLQTCSRGEDIPFPYDVCVAFDYALDRDVDLDDFLAFVDALTGDGLSDGEVGPPTENRGTLGRGVRSLETDR